MTNIANNLWRHYAGHEPGGTTSVRSTCAASLTGERIDVMRRTLAMRTRYMTILTENTFHPQNASALVRHCEAFGVQDLQPVETLCRFDPSVNIVRGTDKWIDITRHESTAEAISSLKGAGYRIVAPRPTRELHARDVRRHEGPVLPGIRDGARRRVGRDIRRAADEVPSHTHVRHGREPQRLGLGRHTDIHALAAHASVGCRLASDGDRVQRGDVPLGDGIGARFAAHTRSSLRRRDTITI